MTEQQTRGRTKNAAVPGGKPDPATSDKAVLRTGRHEQRTAGPDGPSAAEVGDIFKRAPADPEAERPPKT